jgi:hypothetical protein
MRATSGRQERERPGQRRTKAVGVVIVLILRHDASLDGRRQFGA